MQKNKIGSLYHAQKLTQNGLDSNVRPETIKFLEVNIIGMLLDFGLGNDFFGFDTKGKGDKNRSY